MMHWWVGLYPYLYKWIKFYCWRLIVQGHCYPLKLYCSRDRRTSFETHHIFSAISFFSPAPSAASDRKTLKILCTSEGILRNNDALFPYYISISHQYPHSLCGFRYFLGEGGKVLSRINHIPMHLLHISSTLNHQRYLKVLSNVPGNRIGSCEQWYRCFSDFLKFVIFTPPRISTPF